MVTLPVASMLAVKEFVLLQITWPEISTVLLSVKMRSAVSLVGWLPPIKTDELAGEMLKPVGTGGPMLNATLPITEPEAAVTVTMPCLSVVRSPVELTVAKVASEVDQFAEVSGFAVPSEKFPVAVNWSVSPAATEEFCEVIVIDWRVTGIGPPPLLPPAHAVRTAAVQSRPRYTNSDR